MQTDQLQKRLAELKLEHAAGEQQLKALEDRAKELRNTMARIGGAIQVLEELLQEQAPAGA
jgi:septal ring factor EnvC (AmiA/AmiB activator)